MAIAATIYMGFTAASTVPEFHRIPYSLIHERLSYHRNQHLIDGKFK